MTKISRPVLAALLAVVGFAGLWFTTLKPSPSASDATSAAAPPPTLPGVAGLGRAVTRAHAAVAASNGQSATAAALSPRPGGATAAPGPPATPGAATAATATAATPGATTPAVAPPRPPAAPLASAPATDPRVAQISRALAAHEVVAIFFHDPAGASDAAARTEFAAVPPRPNTVMLSLPISAVADVPTVTQGVAVTSAPSVVIVDRSGHATVLAGFVDRVELAGRIAGADA